MHYHRHSHILRNIQDSLVYSRLARPDKRYVLLYAPLQFEYRYYVSSRDGDNDISGRLDFLLWSYDPDYWFDCRESIEVGQRSADPNRSKSRWTRVNYEAFSNLLSVNMSWICDDESPGNP
ncbi:uncharacterized protein C8A04DRAFT_31705 [Dichotomopilus funicola]|uniref:Uncharacterized protein n=1 Tax=Dichotomopilus funicola TaxID=1934379 RepID=A0AAN6UX37_9PEZI|nr:hypothetical protein C8A04DRAFT_31705 [Dichotomopilus funicola]